MRVLSLAVFGTIFFWFPSAATAQSVAVRVTAAESGTPLAGAFVSLIDETGNVVRSALTSGSGRFVFPIPGPGRYRVRAELIGRETAVSPFVTGGEPGTATVDLSLAVHALALAGIRVVAGQRCRLRPDEASEVARVWEEARKPLAVQAWAERDARYRLDISTWERDLDRDGRTVQRENRRASSSVTRVPFASLPPDDLMRGGFVRMLDSGGYEYHGPDATLLLSEPFLDSHCLRLTRSSDRPGEIGLAFEPAGDGGFPDIRGTLWLDEQTAALRIIEYRYTWAPYVEAEGLAGGRVEFEAQPDGAWLIRRWWIRAPIVGRLQNMARAGDTGIRVVGIRETGGEVVGVSRLDGQRITQAERGSVRGVVWDSTTSVPLAGAVVRLSGTAYNATTDGDGRFAIEGVPAGVFTAGFTHPRLDSLGVAAAVAEAEVIAGGFTEVALGVPSYATIQVAACRTGERVEDGAVLSGIVTDLASGRRLPGARVRLEWQEVERVEPVVRALNQWSDVGTDADGRYTACALPVDKSIRISASFLDHEGDTAETSFAAATHGVVDLAIELPPGLLARPGVVSDVLREFGAQGVQGVLVDRESGHRIRTAEISVHLAAGRIIGTAVTDQDGFFRVRTPTPGRYLVSARALGYGDVAEQAVDVSLGKLSVLEVRMAPEALALEPIVVTAEQRTFHLEMEGFYRRQAEGFGVFMTPELLEERRPHKVTNLFFGLPGVRVIEPSQGAGGRAVYFRGGERSGGVCWPMVYVDRHLVSTGGLPGAGAEPTAVDDVVFAADVLAIEAFRSPAEIPSEFSGPNAGCGVIVLWTRRGGG